MLGALDKVSAKVLAIPRRSGRCTKVTSAATAEDSNVFGGLSLTIRIDTRHT